ncbi:hypothetical protein C1879_03255 [Paraeggerthella hongkongensis]|uniref:hypothetical protein n=1 Tax=Paraeggerthella sp. TaxID=2897350 RepID=UPI000DF837E8|nr:hypothetical protein C1879_03255 [Paraeggerthella hongkongensis]
MSASENTESSRRITVRLKGRLKTEFERALENMSATEIVTAALTQYLMIGRENVMRPNTNEYEAPSITEKN